MPVLFRALVYVFLLVALVSSFYANPVIWARRIPFPGLLVP